MSDAAVRNLGMPPAASESLSALGGDLTLSVAFAIANELLAAAKDAELSDAELIGVVLSTSIVLTAVPNAVWLARTEVAALWSKRCGGKDTHSPDPDVELSSGMLSFIALFVRVAQRISMSICVQLVAANVTTQQPLRVVRVLTLLGVAVFFVFLESTATIGRVAGRAQ